MSADLAIQFIGAGLILAGFVLSQARMLDERSYPYLLLNLTGGAILAVLALQGQRWGFVLLEGVWTLVALAGLIARLTGRGGPATH